MEEQQVADTIQLRRDTATNWSTANSILSQGEPGYETDTGKLKIGDGSTAWTDLSYYEVQTNYTGTVFSFTTDTALTAGDPVVINSGGNVEAVSATSNTAAYTFGTIDKFSNGSNASAQCRVIYSPFLKKYIYIYTNIDTYSISASYDTYVSLGDASPNNGIFSYARYSSSLDPNDNNNHQSFDSTTNFINSASVYHPPTNDILFVNQVYGYIRLYALSTTHNGVLTVEATHNITTSFTSGFSLIPIDIVYDSINQTFVVLYSDYGNSYYGTAVVGEWDGTTFTIGSPTVFTSNQLYGPLTSEYDPTNGKFVAAYNLSSANNSKYIVGTVSGNTVSFGSETAIDANDFVTDTFYDSTSGSFIFSKTSGPGIDLIAGSLSGNTLSFGSAVTVTADDVETGRIAKDTNNEMFVVSYLNKTQSNTAYVATFEISNTTITAYSQATTGFDSLTDASYSSDLYEIASDIVFHGDAGVFSLFCRSGALTTGNNQCVSFSTSLSSNLTDQNFIGFADNNYSAASNASIDLVGGINENQSGLVTGQKYYLTKSGSLVTSDTGIFAGTAISNSKIIVKG